MDIILLAATILIAIFCRNRAYVFGCVIITSVFAFGENDIHLIGLFGLAILAALTYAYYNWQNAAKRVQLLYFILLVTLSAQFVLHNMPGFNLIISIKSIKVSDLSRAYTMYMNFDKVLAALLLYTLSPLITQEKLPNKKALQQTGIILLLNILVILLPAVATGYVKVDVKIPQVALFWMMNNLLFVTFSEEVIFRGILQKGIASFLPKSTKFALLAIVIASIFFGLAHYKDGAIFMLLAGVCGLFYGYTYYRTNRILCAMLVHFLLNFTHFIFFTYPAAL
jgi:membrane protease YdiL (CAAX protease family)